MTSRKLDVTIDYTIVANVVPLALEICSEYRRQVAGFVYNRAQRS